MQSISATLLLRLLTLLLGLLILKVTASILLGYADYFPPNFQNGFLQGREAYYFGPYRWACYAHLLSGPLCLLLALALVSDRFRKRFPRWHRSLGKLQGLAVLVVLTPSGLGLAPYAETGIVAAAGFAALAVATATCVLCGWRAAVQRRFAVHQAWMWRCFLLLCSAVVLRLMGGLATVTGIDGQWTYQLAAWASWLGPLAVFELWRMIERRRYSPSAEHAAMSRSPHPAFDETARNTLPPCADTRPVCRTRLLPRGRGDHDRPLARASG